MNYITLFIFLLSVNAVFGQFPEKIDIQGHRGCRSLYPENSIPGFIHAIKLDVTTLELDVVVTKDNNVVVCHDPILNELICKTEDCSAIDEYTEKRIYHLTYEELKKFDCGCSGNPDFKEQKKMNINIPLLSEMIDSVESYISMNGLNEVFYNIEIKSKEVYDSELTPRIKEFSELVYAVISEKDIRHKVIIQSFDIRALQEIRSIDNNIPIALLVSNMKGHKKNIQTLGFTPDIYSPYFRFLNKKAVKELHEQGIKVIPWTVNKKTKIEKLIHMGVDGIITDDPRLLKNTVNAN